MIFIYGSSSACEVLLGDWFSGVGLLFFFILWGGTGYWAVV